jgi:hypothetical protein
MVHLLLDFDGVILRDKNLISYQSKRSAKFVKQHTQLPMRTAEYINKKYYPKHGHTVMMLNERFFKNITLDEYNDFVFNKSNIARLPIPKETIQYGKSFQRLFNQFDTTIFTNAHLNWVTHFIDVFDLSPSQIIWPQEISLLKPNEKPYNSIEKQMPNVPKAFVDDSKINLEYPSHHLHWHTIHYTEDHNPSKLLEELNSFAPTSISITNS